MENELKEQQENSKHEHLRPWQFKPGQSGNPAGRPPGRSLKDFAKSYLAGMTDEERIAFFEGLDKIDLWHMAEGKPDSKTEVAAKIEVKQITGMKIVKDGNHVQNPKSKTARSSRVLD